MEAIIELLIENRTQNSEQTLPQSLIFGTKLENFTYRLYNLYVMIEFVPKSVQEVEFRDYLKFLGVFEQ